MRTRWGWRGEEEREGGFGVSNSARNRQKQAYKVVRSKGKGHRWRMPEHGRVGQERGEGGREGGNDRQRAAPDTEPPTAAQTYLHGMPLPVVVVPNLGIVEVGDAALGRGRRHGALCRRKE